MKWTEIGGFEFLIEKEGEHLLSVKRKKYSREKNLRVPKIIGDKPIKIINKQCFEKLKLNILDLSALEISVLSSYIIEKTEISEELILPEIAKIEEYCCDNCKIKKITIRELLGIEIPSIESLRF